MPEPIIDAATLDDLKAAAGDEFVVELVDTFLEEAPQILVELRAALESQDADAFRRAAHSLKSNATTFGATALAEMSRDLELGALPVGADSTAALQAEYERAAAALSRLVHG